MLVGVLERVAGPGLAGVGIEPERLAAQRRQVARVGADGGVAGADVQRAVAGDQQPAAAVATAGGREAGDDGAQPGRLGGVGVELPGVDPDVVPAAVLHPARAGVEGAVLGEVGVDLERHQPGLAGDPDPTLREGDGAALPTADGREPGAVSLGDQQRPAGQALHVPRVVQPVHDRPDPQPGQPLRGPPLPLEGRRAATRVGGRGPRRRGRGVRGGPHGGVVVAGAGRGDGGDEGQSEGRHEGAHAPP